MKVKTKIMKPAANTCPDSTRYAIACAKVTSNDSGKGKLWSTNSRTLAVTDCQVEDKTRNLIPGELLGFRKSKKEKSVTINGDIGLNSDGKGSDVQADEHYGRFPDAPNVIPDITDDHITIAIDPELLLELTHSLIDADQGECKIFLHIDTETEFGAVEKPIIATTDHNESIGVIMPMSADRRSESERQKEIASVKSKKTDAVRNWEASKQAALT